MGPKGLEKHFTMPIAWHGDLNLELEKRIAARALQIGKDREHYQKYEESTPLFSEEELSEIAKNILSALSFLHIRGICH